MDKFEYAAPKDLNEVFECLGQSGSHLKAGGVDILDLMKENIITPERLVDIRSLPELRSIRQNKEGVHIGSAVTLSDLASKGRLREEYRALAQSADSAATPQIRNMATLGGNLCQRPRCWYFRSADFHCLRKGGQGCFATDGENQNHAIFGNQDSCVMVHPSSLATALIALDAKLQIAALGKQREIAVEDFFVAPKDNATKENVLEANEVISEITLPSQKPGFISYYYKQKHKQTFDWPIAEVAVALQMDGKKCLQAKVVLGSAAPTPWRSKEAEAVLNGKEITKDLAAEAADAAMKSATPLSQNSYKVSIFRAVIKRTICWAVGIDPLV